MEVYIDDMLIKSKERPDHATHLQQVFDLLRTYGMKLNLEKCAFGVSAGRFLGFMMTQRGIEANPSQLKAILESPAPSSRKEVQQLTGRLAALGQFISPFTNRLKPFFATLRGANQIRWNEDCDGAFIQIKQRHGFFVSKSLADVETKYSHLEQAALALRIATKKLRPYFQAHPITVLTDLPLRSNIHKPDLSRRMDHWAIELSEYDIQYKLRISKKGQVLVDFIAELPQLESRPNSLDWWTLNIDGASKQTGVDIGLQLKSLSGDKIEQAIRLGFNASKNQSTRPS